MPYVTCKWRIHVILDVPRQQQEGLMIGACARAQRSRTFETRNAYWSNDVVHCHEAWNLWLCTACQHKGLAHARI